MSLTLEKQNAYRRRYAKIRPDWSPATEVYERLIREYLLPGMRVLDAGCGRGGVLEQLGDAVSYPLGLDPDWESLVEHRLPDLSRFVGMSDQIGLKYESVDMLLSSWVLEHVQEPERTFAEAARVLKTGGYFVFITPNANSLVAWMNRVLRPLQAVLVPLLYGREEADTFPVVYRANQRRELEKLAEGAGFEVVKLLSIKDPTYLAFHPLLFRLNVWLSGLLPEAMAEHLVGVLRKR